MQVGSPKPAFFFACLLLMTMACIRKESLPEPSTSASAARLSPASDPVEDRVLPEAHEAIAVDDSALRMVYGAYRELQLVLAGSPGGPVRWSVPAESPLPPGLDLEISQGTDAMIFGTPLNTGEWCSLVTATDSKKKTFVRQLCFFSDHNEALNYPRFNEVHVLPDAVAGTQYRRTIAVNRGFLPSANVTIDHFNGTIPLGLQLKFARDNLSATLAGRTNVGTNRFALRIYDNEGRSSYKQFQLTSRASKEPRYTCPAGYYFDPYREFCSPTRAEPCPAGQYFEPEIAACRTFPRPPPGIACDAGEYFDPFLAGCAPAIVERCPFNFRANIYSNRCEHELFSCQDGLAHDRRARTCTQVWPVHCREKEHYDPFLQNCEPNFEACAAGHYWDRRAVRCQSADLGRCAATELWVPARRKCEARGPWCDYSFHYVKDSDTCEPNVYRANRCHFDDGEHFNPVRGACERNVGNLKADKRARATPPRPRSGRPKPPPPILPDYGGDPRRVPHPIPYRPKPKASRPVEQPTPEVSATPLLPQNS